MLMSNFIDTRGRACVLLGLIEPAFWRGEDHFLAADHNSLRWDGEVDRACPPALRSLPAPRRATNWWAMMILFVFRRREPDTAIEKHEHGIGVYLRDDFRGGHVVHNVVGQHRQNEVESYNGCYRVE